MGFKDFIKTPTYYSWSNMKTRCYNPNRASFVYYGARGITVCNRWLTFKNFYEDMGEKPEGTTIERINNDKGYSPENCKWASPKEQGRNTRHTKRITYGEKTQCIAAWAEELGINRYTLYTRLKYYPPEIAFNRKLFKTKNKKNGRYVKYVPQ